MQNQNLDKSNSKEKDNMSDEENKEVINNYGYNRIYVVPVIIMLNWLSTSVEYS